MAKLKIISEADNEVLAYADFNMNDYGLDNAKIHSLKLRKDNDEPDEETYNHIDICLQGSYAPDIPIVKSLKK